MQTKLKELKARQAAEIAELEKEECISSLCPVTPSFITIHRDSVSVTYKSGKGFPARHSFTEAYAILEQWLPLIIIAEDWKGSCRSIRPIEINGVEKENNATMNGQSFACVKLQAGRGYDSHALKFWAKLGDAFVNVSIELQPEWKWLPSCEFKYDTNGDCIKSTVSPKCIGEDALVRWWSPAGSYQLEYHFADSHNFKAFASNYVPDSQF